MNIGIDCGSLSVADENKKTGVYQVNDHFVEEIANLDKKNRYWLYSFSPLFDINLPSNFENKVIKPKKGWLNISLSLEFLRQKPDIFIATSQALPLYHPFKSIIFVYDLAFELFPQFYKANQQKLSWQTKRAVKNGTIIITTSVATKNDLVKIYNVPPEKIIVAYPGVDKTFSPRNKNEITKTLEKYSVKKPYMLFLGSLKPGKNAANIIESFERLPSEIKNEYQLIMAGSNFAKDSKLDKIIDQNEKKGFLKYLGFVPEEDLPCLYSGASIFLSPSLYEGFGLPVLEAMACGCPVITSKTGSLPEVVGDSGILVDPNNVDEISKATLKILNDQNLEQKLRALSLKQAKKFTWENFAKKIYTHLAPICSP